MLKKINLFGTLAVFAVNSLFAQTNPTIQFEELLNAQVAVDSKNILSPFCGGLNATQPNHADLNNDGKDDITIYDQNTLTLKTFINVGNPGEERYQYDPKYAKNFPPISHYLKLIDYNCDGIPDLFHKGGSGISVSTGSYVNNELHFTYYQDLYYPGFFGVVNAYVQPNDIPIIEDVDGDGDLDFVSFGVLGAKMEYYKNLRVEDNLPCDSIRITYEDPCYGKAIQTFDRTHLLMQNCKGISGNNKKQRHSGNCILSIDINGDGLKDVLGGNISFNDAQLLINGGTPTNCLFTSQDTLFDADNHQLEIASWPAPFYFDIDNDNDKDLVFAPHNDDINSANYNAMAVYENTGSTATPNFIWRNDSAFVDQMIDMGRNSHPTFFDYDKDGKLDLFLGGEGYYNTVVKERRSQLAYYKNTSSIGNVSFELVSKDFLNLSTKNYKGIYPTFGDITGDGVDDLVLGNDSGTLAVYQNTETSNATAPNFLFQTDSLPGIDVGRYSFPLIYDFNSDGKSDLLIGCEVGTLYLYEDTSLTAVKELKRIDTAISNIKTGSIYSFFSYGVPFIGPVDSSGKPYLLVGTIEGDIQRFDAFSNQHTGWIKKDSTMGNIKSAYRAAPACADLDGDQRPELVVGNQNGGLKIYQFVKNIDSSVGVRNVNKNLVDIKLFPNPAGDALWVKAPTDLPEIRAYRILDISGRTIIQSQNSMNSTQSISTAALNSGLYFIEIAFGQNQVAKAKFMKK